jgi:hypothetical protein
MSYVGYIKKGTKIFIYGIEYAYGKQMLGTNPVLGKDILKSDDDYNYHDGNLGIYVSREKLHQAIDEYVKENFPKAKQYTYKTFDSEMNSITVAVGK